MVYSNHRLQFLNALAADFRVPYSANFRVFRHVRLNHCEELIGRV
jgi:hypothetical protein